jgi:hypothetical protein
MSVISISGKAREVLIHPSEIRTARFGMKVAE